MKQALKIFSVASATALIGITGSMGAAYASPIPSSQGAVTNSITRLNASCLAAVSQSPGLANQNQNPDICKETITTVFGQSRNMTIADIASVSTKLSSADRASLTAAVISGTVKSRGYLQQVNNLTDSETQTGTFYYDGSRVWVTSTYRGLAGSHRCTVDWSVGYSVALQGCYESGSTSAITLAQQWLFTPFVNGFPVSWSQTYSIRVNATGQVY